MVPAQEVGRAGPAENVSGERGQPPADDERAGEGGHAQAGEGGLTQAADPRAEEGGHAPAIDEQTGQGDQAQAADERAQERRQARAAAAAEASDFNPLRVRPYVSLPDSDGPESHRGVVAQPLPPLAVPAVTDTVTLRAVAAAPPPQRRGRNRRFVALLVLGGVAGVAAIALLTSALVSGDAEDEALPDSPSSRSVTLAPPPSPSASRSAPAPKPKRSPSAVPGTTAPAAPSPAPAEPKASPTPKRPEATVGPTLSRGDRGAEVAELQRRLQQAFVYAGPANGVYDVHVENAVRGYQFTRGVTGDPKGVYGTATRKRLEASTQG